MLLTLDVTMREGGGGKYYDLGFPVIKYGHLALPDAFPWRISDYATSEFIELFL